MGSKGVREREFVSGARVRDVRGGVRGCRTVRHGHGDGALSAEGGETGFLGLTAAGGGGGGGGGIGGGGGLYEDGAVSAEGSETGFLGLTGGGGGGDGGGGNGGGFYEDGAVC